MFLWLISSTSSASGAAQQMVGGDPPADPYRANPMMKRETLELVRAYLRIADPHIKRRVFELTKALASAYSGATGSSDEPSS